MIPQKSLVQLPIPRIDVTAGADRPAPRVGRLVRKTLGEPLRHPGLQRVIGGVPYCPENLCAGELRVGHDEVFWESAISKHSADLTGKAGVRGEVSRYSRHVAVRDKTAGPREPPQRGGAAEAIDSNRADTGEIESAQHRIEQWCIAAGLRGMDSLHQSILDDDRTVDIDAAEQLRAFAANVPRFEREILCQFPLMINVEILDLGIPLVDFIYRRRLIPLRHRHDGKDPVRVPLRYREFHAAYTQLG